MNRIRTSFIASALVSSRPFRIYIDYVTSRDTNVTYYSLLMASTKLLKLYYFYSRLRNSHRRNIAARARVRRLEQRRRYLSLVGARKRCRYVEIEHNTLLVDIFSCAHCRTMFLLMLTEHSRVHPEVWCKYRSTEWWRDVMNGLYGDDWWKENLRMSESTFKLLCDELRPHIERQTTKFREAVSVEARVAVTIWRLGSNFEYRTIASLFGIGRSTIGEIVLDTCDAIANHLLPRYVRVPRDAVLQDIVNGFLELWKFPRPLEQLMDLIFRYFDQKRAQLITLTEKASILL